MISCRSSLYDFNFLFLKKKLKKKAKNTTTYETIRHICWNSGSVCNNEHTFEKDLHANNQFHPFFPRCWRDTGNLLLWVLWACLATTIKNTLWRLLHVKKSNITIRYHTWYFATLYMPGHTHQKLQDQLVGNFDVYLHANNKLNFSILSWDTAKMMQTYFGYSGHVWPRPPRMIALKGEFYGLCFYYGLGYWENR